MKREEYKYLAYDPINGDWIDCSSLEDARETLVECFLDDGEGYHPDAETCRIYKLVEEVVITTLDYKDNYKYESEEEAIEANDEVAINKKDYWPYDSNFECIAKHEFKKVE